MAEGELLNATERAVAQKAAEAELDALDLRALLSVPEKKAEAVSADSAPLPFRIEPVAPRALDILRPSPDHERLEALFFQLEQQGDYPDSALLDKITDLCITKAPSKEAAVATLVAELERLGSVARQSIHQIIARIDNEWGLETLGQADVVEPLPEAVETQRTTLGPRPEGPRLPEVPVAERAPAQPPTYTAAFELFKRLKQLNQELQTAKQAYERVSRGARGVFYATFLLHEQDKARFQLHDSERELARTKQEYQDILQTVAQQEGVREAELEEEFDKDLQGFKKQERKEAEAMPKEMRRRSAKEQIIWFWTKEIAKGLSGAGASIVGVKFFYDGVQYLREQRARRKASAEVTALLNAVEQEASAAVRTAARADEQVLFSEEKCAVLFEKLNKLVEEKTLTPERRDIFLVTMRDNIFKRLKTEQEAARAKLIQDSSKELQDYLETKVSQARVGRELLNTVSVLAGMQLARGVTMLMMGAVERTVVKLRERNLKLREQAISQGGEARTAKVWATFWQDTVGKGLQEYGRALAARGATKERVTFFARGMDFGKALGTTARFVGIGSAVWAELEEEQVSKMISQFMDELERKGLVTFWDNALRNVWQVFHLHPTGERGQEELAALQKATSVPPVAETEVVSGTMHETSPRFFASEQILQKNGVVKMLVDKGQAEFKEGVLTIALGEHDRGFSEIQQALRRLVDQEIKLPTGQLRDIDAERSEKMVKMLTHLLRGETLPSAMFDKGAAILEAQDLQGIIGFTPTGDLIVHDYARFENELMPKLETLTDQYHVSMMAYINNTGHKAHQSIMDARASVTGQPITVEDFDQSPAVQAHEERVFTMEAKALTGAKDVTPVDIDDEETGTFRATLDDIIPVELRVDHGNLADVMDIRNGKHFTFADNITFDDPLARSQLHDLVRTELERMTQEGDGMAVVSEQAVAGGDAVVAEVSAPHDARDLVRPLDKGGLKGPDGKLHFGNFAIQEDWFTQWDDMSAEDFIDEAPARFSPARLFSAENDAHYKLAHAMELHKANLKMIVGQWVVENYKKIGEWTR